MAFRVLHGLAPPYLNQLARVADLPRRRRLRSASLHQRLKTFLFCQSFPLITIRLRGLCNSFRYFSNAKNMIDTDVDIDKL